MSVWTLIQEHSTAAPGSTFWEHLNAQEGGGGGFTILGEGFELEIDMQCYELEIESNEFELEIEPTIEYELEIENNEYELEICDG